MGFSKITLMPGRSISVHLRATQRLIIKGGVDKNSEFSHPKNNIAPKKSRLGLELTELMIQGIAIASERSLGNRLEARN